MKVLVVNDYGTLSGGAEYMSRTLREGLRKRGHEARFFATTARPHDAENVADETCFGTMGPARRVLQVANPWAVHRLRRVLDDFQPDIVHVRLFLTQLSPLILPLLRDVPALFHVVNYFPVCPLGTKMLPDGSSCRVKSGVACYQAGCVSSIGLARTVVQKNLLRRWYDVFDVVVANSEWTRRRLQADGVRCDETIWNGVPRRAARPPLSDPPTASFAGRFYEKKGIDVLLHAMAHVHRTIPDARLILAGDGPVRADCEALASRLGIASQVTFVGYQPRAQLEPVLGSAWVQAVPSRWEEPFGLVAGEGLMRGTAVVATNTGGLSELVQDGITGFSVPPNDADALAEALLAILSDRERAERMGQAGRTFALNHLTEDHVVENFLDVYHRITGIAPRSARPPRQRAAVGGE